MLCIPSLLFVSWTCLFTRIDNYYITCLHWKPLIYTGNHLLTQETTCLHWKPLIYTGTTCLHWKPLIYTGNHLFTPEITYLHWKSLIYTGNHLFTLEIKFICSTNFVFITGVQCTLNEDLDRTLISRFSRDGKSLRTS